MHPVYGEFCHWPAWPIPFDLDLEAGGVELCPYLPGRASRFRSFWVDDMAPGTYHRFMDAGFRRTGHLLYQPVCEGCRECVPIRVEVARFAPSKSQRRVQGLNQDLRWSVGTARATAEKLDLYNRYVREWHGGAGIESAHFEMLFYDSPVQTVDFEHRNEAGELVAVGLCDLSAESLSSVYFYFAPELAERSLGTWGALCELEFCQGQGIPYYYLGYWIEHCSKMNYKIRFRPSQLLGTDGVWR